ncbi:hypothetical protein SAMN04488128_103730 [Chitinophaga eiseniae]|uniref:Uncharacterized protein n=1 Tax=Chitinophaga eiseniae TaxID=634771 RepID=A0A1T4SY95_9BACT|nr:hypothetical protein [Chitinophaga eiseniae]SKA32881.1 hypothetical protein SAMN04488128_103730 [Chitinophaga eiseniae]
MKKLVSRKYSIKLSTGRTVTVKAASLLSAHRKLSASVKGARCSDIYQDDNTEPNLADGDPLPVPIIFRQYAIMATPARMLVDKATNKWEAYLRFLADGWNIGLGDVYKRYTQPPHTNDAQFNSEHGLFASDSELLSCHIDLPSLMTGKGNKPMIVLTPKSTT